MPLCPVPSDGRFANTRALQWWGSLKQQQEKSCDLSQDCCRLTDLHLHSRRDKEEERQKSKGNSMKYLCRLGTRNNRVSGSGRTTVRIYVSGLLGAGGSEVIPRGSYVCYFLSSESVSHQWWKIQSLLCCASYYPLTWCNNTMAPRENLGLCVDTQLYLLRKIELPLRSCLNWVNQTFRFSRTAPEY